MSLITSISGIRGTIGGPVTDGLNPINIAEFTSAFATFIRRTSPLGTNKIVVGRDARLSGEMVEHVVVGTLQAIGFDVVVLGFSSTPTTEVAVTAEKADGGIIITASHNPKHWNALKLLNHCGEFLNAVEGNEVVDIADKRTFDYSTVDKLGVVTKRDYTDHHVRQVLSLPDVDVNAVREANFTVAVDCVNSVGSVIVPRLLEALGVRTVYLLNGEATGHFAHNPEPLPENLVDLSDLVREKGAHVGFAVDPDVDRLAIICEDGRPFGEENTLVSIADYLLSEHPGRNTVSNLSSTRGLRDVTVGYGGEYFAAAVGEVNVTTKMKEVGALIGGEGNGGVIFPQAHYGRDAMVGIALYLTMLAKRRLTPSQLLSVLPQYVMVKKKVELSPDIDVDAILESVRSAYASIADITTIDGVKLDFEDKWVHLRKSNTEPIIRIYAEAQTVAQAEEIADKIIEFINGK